MMLSCNSYSTSFKSIWQLTKSDFMNIESTWTPDGKNVIYSSNITGNQKLYKIDSNGFTTPTQLTETLSAEAEPCVSPDGIQIAYTFYFNSKSDIWLMNINGTSSIKLIDSDETDCSPKFSPDGKKIAFCSYRNSGTPAIWIYTFEGTATAMLNGSSNSKTPAWSPDGTRLAYIKTDDNNLYTVKADGTDVQQISSDGLGYMNPCYSPDGKYIAVSGLNSNTTKTTIYLFSSATPDQKWEIVDSISMNYLYPQFSVSGAYMMYNFTADPLSGVINIGKSLSSYAFKEYPQSSITSIDRITSYPKSQTVFLLEEENKNSWKMVRVALTPPAVSTDIITSQDRLENIIVGNDGTNVTYIKNGSIGRSMYSRNLNTNVDTKLTTSDSFLIGGAIHGDYHYYATLNGGGSKIYQTNLEGSSPKLIWRATNLYASLVDINSSQKTDELLITVQEGEYQDIYTLSTDGNTLKNLNNDKHIDYNPSSSSDGTTIAFTSGRHGSFSLWTMSATDGSNLTKITQSDYDDLYPCFLSDGEIVFIRNDFYNKVVMVLPLKNLATVKNEFFQGTSSDLQHMINSRYMHNKKMMTENLKRFFK